MQSHGYDRNWAREKRSVDRRDAGWKSRIKVYTLIWSEIRKLQTVDCRLFSPWKYFFSSYELVTFSFRRWKEPWSFQNRTRSQRTWLKNSSWFLSSLCPEWVFRWLQLQVMQQSLIAIWQWQYASLSIRRKFYLKKFVDEIIIWIFPRTLSFSRDDSFANAIALLGKRSRYNNNVIRQYRDYSIRRQALFMFVPLNIRIVAFFAHRSAHKIKLVRHSWWTLLKFINV